MDIGWVEVFVVGNRGPVVVSGETLGFVVTVGSINGGDVPPVSAGLDDVVLSVYGTTADQEVVSEWETKGVVVSVTFRDGAEVVVVAASSSLDVLVSVVVTLVVAVLQSDVEEVGAWVVVVAVEYRTDAGSCDAVVEEVVSLDEVMGRVLCVVTSTDVVSSLGTDVVLLVTNGSTDVTDFVVLVALTVDGDTFPISTSGRVL